MDLYRIKASCLCTFCSLTVFFYDVKNLVFGKRTRDLAAFFGWNADAETGCMLILEETAEAPAWLIWIAIFVPYL